MRARIRAKRSQRGIVLFAALATVAVLGLIVLTAGRIVQTDLKMTGAYLDSAEAFQQAEAGLHQVLSRLDYDYQRGALDLTSGVSFINIAQWGRENGGYNYACTTLRRLCDVTNGLPVYSVDVEGRKARANGITARCTLRALFSGTYQSHTNPLSGSTGTNGPGETVTNLVNGRGGTYALGVFGDVNVSTKNASHIYSYYSRDPVTGQMRINPTPADSTGEASMGSNSSMDTYMRSLLDGSLVFGADTFGDEPTWVDHGAIITGDKEIHVGRVDPDPMGLNDGWLKDVYNYAQTVNDNAYLKSLGAMDNQNDLNLPYTAGSGNSKYTVSQLTLTNGVYFFHNFDLGNNARINVDPAGSVIVFVENRIQMGNGSALNPNGLPPGLTIISPRNSSGGSWDLVLNNTAGMSASVYAPNSTLQLDNSSVFRGLLWGKDVEHKNSGSIYVDLTLLGENYVQGWYERIMKHYPGWTGPTNRPPGTAWGLTRGPIRVFSWKEVRGDSA